MVIRYDEDEVRGMGRAARGVRAISMREGDYLVGFDIVPSNNENIDLLIITNDGYGKRVKIGEFRVQGRGGLGLIAIKFKSPNSKMACLINIESKQEFMIATSNGVIVRQMAENISVNKITNIEESGIENNNLDPLSNDSMPEDMDPMDDFVTIDDENM